MILTAYNPATTYLEKSYLQQAYAAGVTSIKVRNNNTFAINDRVLLGESGSEKAEILTVATVNADGVTITLSAGTRFPHSADDPVYQLKYDQVKFYRSTTGISGTYNLLATVALDVDNADKTTKYDDTTGLTSYFYKVSYYHSIAAIESALSDPIPGSGYTRNQVGTIVNDFLIDVDDIQQKYMTVPQILSILNEVNDDLSTQSRKPYRFQKTSSLLTITANTRTVALPTTLQKFDRVNFNYALLGDNRKDNLRVITMEEIEYIAWDQNQLADSNTLYVALDETTNELVFYPTPKDTQTNVLRVYFWQKFTDFDSLGDTILPPTPRIYKLFLHARFWRHRAVKENAFLSLADRYSQDYSTEVVKLQRTNKLDLGSKQGMRPDTMTAKGLRKY